MKSNNTQGFQEGVYTPEPRVYEFGYILMPNLDEGNLSKERDALVALITRYKGIVISEGQPQLIDLAYEMTKVISNKKHSYSQGYFGWIKFDITPDVVDELTDELEATESVIRSLMIKTVRENTIVSEQPFKLARTNASDDEEDQDDLDEEIASAEEEGSEDDLHVDDLTIIEGIGPKIAEIFVASGIRSYDDLSASKVGDLRNLLADNDLSQHDPKSWSKQATLAKHGKFEELKALQDELKGGK